MSIVRTGAVIAEGAWKGWQEWIPVMADDDNPATATHDGMVRFLDLLGPIYWRLDGRETLMAVDAVVKHTNLRGNIHGGLQMALIDCSTLVSCMELLGANQIITLQLSTDFLAPTVTGAPLVVRGRVDKETGRMIWLSGTVEQLQKGANVVATRWYALIRKVSIA